MKQTLVIPNWLPQPLANGSHGHWMTRATKVRHARRLTHIYVLKETWRPIRTKAKLTITLVFPVNRKRDQDNLYARVKGVVDGIKPWIVDDSTEWLELVVKAEVRKGIKQTELELEAI